MTKDQWLESRRALRDSRDMWKRGYEAKEAEIQRLRDDLLAQIREAISTWEGDSLAMKWHADDLVAHIERTLMGNKSGSNSGD